MLVFDLVYHFWKKKRKKVYLKQYRGYCESRHSFHIKNSGHLGFMTKLFSQFNLFLFYWIQHPLNHKGRYKNQENTKILSKDMAHIELEYNLMAAIFNLCKKGVKSGDTACVQWKIILEWYNLTACQVSLS